MAAKPSSESARETRSTLTVSTRSVSARAPGPNSRAIEAVTFAGGAVGDCATSSRTANASVTSELVTDPEAQHFGLPRPRRIAKQLIVTLERGVPGGLVGDAERRDAACQRPVSGHADGDARLGVVALVTDERVELLRGRRREEPQHVVGSLEIAPGDAASDGLPGGVVERLRVTHADVRHHGA